MAFTLVETITHAPFGFEPRTPDADLILKVGRADLAEQEWLCFEVQAALERLPERERQVLELAYWSGLSQSEVASYLDVPLGTVKTRTRAGLARLAGLLEEVRE